MNSSLHEYEERWRWREKEWVRERKVEYVCSYVCMCVCVCVYVCVCVCVKERERGGESVCERKRRQTKCVFFSNKLPFTKDLTTLPHYPRGKNKSSNIFYSFIILQISLREKRLFWLRLFLKTLEYFNVQIAIS